MGSLMPAMAGVAGRVVPCRMAAMPLKERGGRGRVPPFPRPPRWLRTASPWFGRNPKISKLHPLGLHGKRPEVW